MCAFNVMSICGGCCIHKLLLCYSACAILTAAYLWPIESLYSDIQFHSTCKPWQHGGCNHASQLLKCAAFMDSIPLLIMIVAETVSLSALARLIPSRVYPFVKITYLTSYPGWGVYYHVYYNG